MKKIFITNKRGVLFTLLTIIIVSLFALSYSFLSNTNSRESTQKRIETLNSYVYTVEEDISRNLFVAGFRTTYITLEEIRQNPNIINSNFTSVFNESFFEGTYNGNSKSLMQGATFKDIIKDLENSSSRINANVTIENASVYVNQVDPWNLRFNMKFRLKVWDLNGFVSWDKETIASSIVPTKYFDDPMYISKTKGNYNVKVKETIYNNLSNVNNFSWHLDGEYYINHSDAPSFLNRLEGKFIADPNGVESFIDLDKLALIYQTIGGNIENRSNIDYMYFSENNSIWCKVTTISIAPARLDANHRAFYGQNTCYP